MRRVAALAALGLGIACAAPPHLRALDDVDAVQASPKMHRARELAPQAFLAAEKLHEAADAAFDDGRRAEAQVLAEHAIAAYQHAFVLARLARADARVAGAQARLAAAESELQALDAQQAQVAAEADDIEMRLKVARDALPLAPVDATSPKREAARLEAARSIALEARLLCVATSLLNAKHEGLADTRQKLDALDASLAAGPEAAPIADATRLRAACLAHLTQVRRPALRERPEISRGDELLEQLSRAKLEPHRDDRGVVVVVPAAFRGAKLADDARSRLEALGAVAREQSDTPLLAVLHRARGAAAERDRQRLTVVVDTLRAAGAANLEGVAAGDAAPLLPRDSRAASKHNERIEVVFVTPSW